MQRLSLPQVTLCAVTSVNLEATVVALEICLQKVEFARCLLFTDCEISRVNPRVQAVAIERVGSSRDYSDFILRRLVEFVQTSHVLVIQWDGFIHNLEQWDPRFLEFDYIGAPWPQFADGHDVGNGGFSLRSRRLLEACLDPDFQPMHPEDVAIGRFNRDLLEHRHNIRFADRTLAARFAYERTAPDGPTFGFHGIFNMIDIVGADGFWEIYQTLDDKRTAFVDFGRIMRQLGRGPQPMSRRLRLSIDRLAAAAGR